MKKYFRHIFFTGIIVVSLQLLSFGQERTIKGLVTTFDSILISNATVVVKSTKQEVKTDSLGEFTVVCKPKDKIKVAAHGFYTRNVKIKPEINIALVNLQLMPGPENREYAIGYGHVKDEERLNAISSLNNSDLNFSQYTSIYELIRGKFPGVQIENGDIIIRGKISINGSSAALIVVDGIVSEKTVLQSITPNDVKSINIIKDGAASIYGAMGATGVVLIDTKRGGE